MKSHLQPQCGSYLHQLCSAAKVHNVVHCEPHKQAPDARMVSLGRLLAAASDSPDSSQAHSRSSQSSATSKHWLREHALSEEVFSSAFGPEGSNAGIVPGALRRSFSNSLASHGESVPLNDLEQPSIPLDHYIADLGPEATTVGNMMSFKRALSRVGCPSEESIAKALVLMAGRKLRGISDGDSDAMSLFQLLSIFESENPGASNDPISPDSGAPSWNFDAFVLVVNEVAQESKCVIDWKLVIRSLDCAELVSVLDVNMFADIANAYTAATAGSRIPASVIVERWQLPTAQNTMLTNALLRHELVDWEELKTFPGATAEDSLSPYSRVSVLERMVDLNMISPLQLALTSKPDLVLLCLACAKPENNTHIQQQLIVTLVSSLISKFPTSARTIRQMWKFAPALIAGGLLAMWRKDSSTSPLVLDITVDLGALQEILSPPMPTEFAFDIALLAYKRESFPLETWLSDHIATNGGPSMTQCILQLAEKVVSANTSGITVLSVDAIRIAFRCLFSSLSGMRSLPATEAMVEDWKRVHDAYVHHDARIAGLDPSNDLGDRTALIGGSAGQGISRSLPGHGDGLGSIPVRPETVYGEPGTSFSHSEAAEGSVQSEPFAKDVEEEVNVHFHSLYKGAITTEYAVDMLRRLKASENSRDRKVFACMIHTLFDEYRFFQNYPDKELRITGLLFGAFVQYSLFQGHTLEMALERVLNALQQVENSRDHQEESSKNGAPFDNSSAKDDQIGRMTKFGLCALDRFRKRLPEWPQYCARILAIPHLKVIAPDLLGEVERIVNNAANYTSSATGHPVFTPDMELRANATVNSTAATSPEITGLREAQVPSVLGSPSRGNHKMSPTLEAANKNLETFAMPNDLTRHEISFCINNLSAVTLNELGDRLMAALKPEHFPYFIHYLVVKRALCEANHHEIYLALLKKMVGHVPNLFKLVLEKSFDYVQVLLSSDKIATNSSERILLRTLGAWIGALTLGRNKPILNRDLDMKKLLLDAYSRGRLTPVIPFVSKVLLGSQSSKVFKPSNPWIKAMLSILKELSQIPELKLNLKFELPSLLTTLNIDPADIVPSNLLKDVQEPSKKNNPDLRKSPHASPLSNAASPDMTQSYSNRATRTEQDNNPALSLGGATTVVSPSMSAGISSAIPSSVPSHVGMPMGMGGGLIGSGVVSSDTAADLASVLGGAPILPGNHNTSLHSVVGNGGANVQPGVTANGQMASQQQTSTPSGPEPTIIPNFAQYVSISPSLSLFQSSPNLKPLLPIAIDRALKDIIQPVVERSCAIASLTTRELTLKDFANEPNVANIRKAAQQMVQQLAGSLALVTCKEPLRVSMGNHVRSILTSAVGTDPQLIDQTSHVICAANLEMGCAIIERAAKEKAVRDLNDVIGPSYSNVRRQHQTSYALSGPPGPDVLKVYADFSRLPRAILGDGSRLSPVPVYTSPAPISHSLGLNPNPAGAQSMSMPVPSSSDVPPFASGQGVLSEKLQDARFMTEKDSMHTQLHPVASVGLHNRIPGTSLDAVVENTGPNVNALSTSSSAQTGNMAQWKSAIDSNATPLMAPAEAMNSAMLEAVATLNAAQASRQHSTASSLAVAGANGDEALSTPQVLEKFNMVYVQLTGVIADITRLSPSQDLTLSGLPSDHEVHHLWTQIPLAVKRSVTADEASMAVAQKVFKRLYEGDSSLYREVHVALLDGLRESCRRLSKELVIWLAYSEERKKLNRECIVALLKPKSLINITSYDELLSKTIDNGRNMKALDFAAFLVQHAVIEEPLATPAELALTLETMAKIGKRPNPPVLPSAPNGLLHLVEAGRNASSRPSVTSSAGDHGESSSGNKNHRESDPLDPSGSREFVNSILTEWQRLVTNDASPQVLQTFLGHLRSKTLNTEESRERFCRLSVELVAAVTSNALLAGNGMNGVTSDLVNVPYTAVESTVRLMSGLCRADTNHSNDSLARSSSILCSFLTALVRNILKTSEFADVRPHYRMFTGLLAELSVGHSLAGQGDVSPGAAAKPENGTTNAADHDLVLFSRIQSFAFLDGKGEGLLAFARDVCESGSGHLGPDGAINISNPGVLAMFAGALIACAPRAAPGFAFCWLQILSGRNMLPRLLSSSSGKGWLLFRQLLVSMLAFLSPHLKRGEEQMTEALRHLYKGTLRVLLVLLHDFPEFLCDYHFALCDVIPPNCIQLRNLVLAAFPKNMRLPDPFRPELQAGELTEMSLQPRILSNYTAALTRAGIKGVIDNFLQNATFRGSITSLELAPRLMIQKAPSVDPVYNVPAINALALYVGQHSLSRSSDSVETALNGAGTALFQTLLKEMDAEGQYHLFNAIANQLRYPNVHTHYFSSVLLHLFTELHQEAFKELITRVLVERLIANRPHPWGLLITFIDLIKNPNYRFWTHGFVRCAPQIEHLFENVARFCIGPALQQSSVVAG